MCKSLASDPWCCFLNSDYDRMVMYFSGLVRSEILVCCFGLELFHVQLNKLVKLLGSIVIIIWTLNEHQNTCWQTLRVK